MNALPRQEGVALQPDGPALRLHGVTLRAGAREILHGVTLQVNGSERIGLIGQNGSGKSSLLRIASGMTAASSGSIDVLGQQLLPFPPREQLRLLHARIGQVFQGLHLVNRLTALENVLMGALGRERSLATLARLYPARETERAHAALATVRMEARAGMRVDRLSGGERQKVAIARALMQEPRLLLVDEATASLDPYAAQEIAALIGDLARSRGLTLIAVVHTLSLLPALCDRVIGMKAGGVALDRPIGELDEALMDELYRR